MADQKHLVVGNGEVGSALYAILREVHGHRALIRDVEFSSEIADVMHVCIPWSNQFVKTIRDYRDHHQVDTVVIHSTVPVGTCDPEGWIHSPIRGRHPNLQRGILDIQKHVGGEGADDVARMFNEVGINTMTHERAATCEAGKLWELIQFGLQVVVRQDMHDWCVTNGLDPEEVYTPFADTYNVGYATLGDVCFIRPILDYVPGPIGGHCVTQNAHLIDHPLARIVSER